MTTIDEFALKNIGLWWRYGISRHCDEWKYIIIGRIFESEIILIPPSLKISESSSNGSYRNTDEVWWRYGISRSCDEWLWWNCHRKTGVRSIFKPFTCMEDIIRGIHLRSVLRHVRVCICFIFLNQQVLEEGKSYPLHLCPILVVAIKISIHWPNPVSPLLSTRFIIVC